MAPIPDLTPMTPTAARDRHGTPRRWLTQGMLAFFACLATLAIAQTPPPAPAPATAIQTARVDSVWAYPQRTAAAQVLPRNESRLTAEAAGTLQRWTVDVGATVKRGDLLAQIDPADLALALQRAEAAQQAAQARLQLGQSQLERAKALVAQGFYSQEAVAQRETEVALQQADLASARAQVSTAQRQLGKTRLHAPFNGSVVQRLAQQGEAVAPGTVLYVLAEASTPEVEAKVDPVEAPGLRKARQLRFALPGQDVGWDLRLLRISPTVQASNRSQTVRLGFVSSSGATETPPSGSSGVLRWEDPTPHLPAQLVVRRGTALGVFVKAGNTAQFVVLPGAQEGRAAATKLPPDTLIVVHGQAALQNGQSLN
jgi:RND family efflux transporter MFP subunit